MNGVEEMKCDSFYGDAGVSRCFLLEGLRETTLGRENTEKESLLQMKV